VQISIAISSVLGLQKFTPPTKSLGPVFGWQSDQCTIQSLATTFIKLFAKDIGRFSAANELQKPANG